MEQAIIRSARVTGPLALAGVALWLYMVAWVAPTEAAQGIVQKIFYVHFPCVLPSYLGFIVAGVGGIGFLATRRESWDRLALAGAEIGVVFCTLVLVTGPIWAKPAWGHWWVWDLRLTSTLILWFIYVAYLFLRAFAYGSDPARTFASVYGILGTAGIPFVYYSVQLARGSTLHPEDPVAAGLPAGMGSTLAAGFIALLVVSAFLLARRLEIARLEAEQPLATVEGDRQWAT